jgi:hypothetical protein
MEVRKKPSFQLQKLGFEANNSVPLLVKYSSNSGCGEIIKKKGDLEGRPSF